MQLRASTPVQSAQKCPLFCRANRPSTQNDTPSSRGSDAPVRFIRWGGTLPSRRRFVQGLTFASFVALGGNFGGMTSFLLSLDQGHLAEKTKLDVLVPVMSFKRCWNPDMGFEFRYPARWLGDQRLIQRVAERVESENPLDLPPLRSRRKLSLQLDPVAAFGPPGGRGDENISVIVTRASPGFSLRSLGSAEAAAKKLLAERIAPEGSDKTAQLVQTSERIGDDSILYYTMEFIVQSPAWIRHNIAVFAAMSEQLYTLNAQCPQSKWNEEQDYFYTMASSFRVFGT